jgi:hypothetical protein
VSVRRIAFPAESDLHARVGEAYYQDAFETELRDANLSAAEIARRTFGSTPAWVEALLGLRNRIVRPLGLKTVGRLKGRTGQRPPAPGDAFSIFTVRSLDPLEIVLGIDDSHLDVRISILKRLGGAAPTYVIASWVKTHNALGRLYMLPVAPFHRLIVAAMMRGVAI